MSYEERVSPEELIVEIRKFLIERRYKLREVKINYPKWNEASIQLIIKEGF